MTDDNQGNVIRLQRTEMVEDVTDLLICIRQFRETTNREERQQIADAFVAKYQRRRGSREVLQVLMELDPASSNQELEALVRQHIAEKTATAEAFAAFEETIDRDFGDTTFEH